MAIARKVRPEMLDHLAEKDPAAIRSRQDLRRIHRVMGTKNIIVNALHHLPPKMPLKVLELGAGDGSLLLAVAFKLAPIWSQVELTLLDKQVLVEPKTIAAYAKLGWIARVQKTDVLDWAQDVMDAPDPSEQPVHYDLIIANLFLHHFEAQQLNILLKAVAGCTNVFFACEPRRAWFALAASHLVGLVGANQVTRTDAVLSVHAGFSGHEISALWQKIAAINKQSLKSAWEVSEYSAGLFSHCFKAKNLRPTDA